MAWGDPIPPRPLPEPRGTYGGNRIPDSYLDAFNRRTDEWLVRIGARKPKDSHAEGLPAGLASFVEDI